MTDDFISRRAAIDAVKKLSLGETDATRLAMRIGDYLERLPPVQLSLESIVHPPILDDAERKYLSAVISPFRDRVKHICRGWYITSSGEYQRNLSIYITLSDDVTSYNIDLPLFKKETMYKGMKIGKAYTLEELGL